MRDRSLDRYKGLLVVFMILAHVIQFLGNKSKVQNIISLYVNLTTFSCFVFIFGMLYQKVYFSKEFDAIKVSLKKNIFKLIISFYISGFFYRLFVTKKIDLLKLITILDIPGYSEFLLSFALISIISYRLFFRIKEISKKSIIVLIFCSYLSTYFPYNSINNSYLGILIGGTKFAFFPVIQYFSYFLWGIYFEKYNQKIGYREMLISGILTSSIILYYIILKTLPSRFPPSLFWILGGHFFSVFYLKVCRMNFNILYLEKIGENSLLYLVLSNIVIFISSNFFKNLNLFQGIIITISITIFIYTIVKIVNIKKIKTKYEGRI